MGNPNGGTMIFNARNLFFAALGAAAMYFLDPTAGTARRESMKRKAHSAYEEGSEKIRSVA
jgi:hypothetical protein